MERRGRSEGAPGTLARRPWRLRVDDGAALLVPVFGLDGE